MDLKHLPKKYVIMAIAGGLVIGLIIRATRAKQSTQVAETVVPEDTQYTAESSLPYSPGQDYPLVQSALPYPEYPDFPMYPDVPQPVATTDDVVAGAPAPPVTKVHITIKQPVAPSMRGKGGSPPDGHTVKGKGHPTHKRRPNHTGRGKDPAAVKRSAGGGGGG